MKGNKILNKMLIIICFMIIFIIFPCFSNNANATTIVLDPGHGGNDPGASSGNLIEKNLTLKIANYLKEYLSGYSNVNVLMTHNGSTMSLEDRADFAINNRADLLISLHINSNAILSKQGVEAYVTYRNDLPKYNKEMTDLGNRILRNISSLGIKNNGVSTRIADNSDNDPEYKYYDGQNGDYYAIIRRAMRGGHTAGLGMDFRNGSGVPTVLVEHAYLSNSHDKQFLDTDSKLRSLAKADADAIIEFYSLNKEDNINVRDYVFNSTYYADMNKDLKAAFGYNENSLKNHYYTFGIKEGRVASPVFDPVYYMNKYSDLKAAYGKNYEALYNHFITFGVKEGRVGSKFFDSNYYLNSYGDLKRTFGNDKVKALRHFATFGFSEGRNGSSEFNLVNYYNNCSVYVKNMLGKNYIKYYAYSSGANVIVDNPIDIRDYLFDANLYYNLYPDLQTAIGNNPTALKNHYYTFGIREGRRASYAFDPVYYLNNHSDLKAAYGNDYTSAYNHFITFGVNEGRRASQEFDVKFYLNNYGDLKNTFGNNYSKALRHYVTFGVSERRVGSKN